MNHGCPRGLALEDNVALYDRYELVELRRDDGVQTFHAREIETARPVQIHILAEGESPENLALLSRLEYLPDAERRRVIERGEYQGRPYVITDRLAGYPGFREWLTFRTDPSVRNSSLDDQFFQLFDPNAETASLSVDEQFYRLFDPNAETAAMTVSPLAAAVSPVAPATPGERRMGRSAARALVGIVLGIVAAILVLGLVMAAVAFRPW